MVRKRYQISNCLGKTRNQTLTNSSTATELAPSVKAKIPSQLEEKQKAPQMRHKKEHGPFTQALYI